MSLSPDAPHESTPRFGDVAANAIRYWESRRVVYNLALLAVVTAHFFTRWPESRAFLAWNSLFFLILMAVLANVAYCAAYAVDIFVQYSTLRATWPRWRWIVLVVGTIFGAVLAHFFSIAMFSEGPP